MFDLHDHSPYSAGFCVQFSLNLFHCFFEVGCRRWLTVRSDSGANVLNDLLDLVQLLTEIKLFSCNLRDGIVLPETIF